MTELNVSEINSVGGGVTMSPDGRSCTDQRPASGGLQRPRTLLEKLLSDGPISGGIATSND
jgi:hypothetical protein